MVLTRAFLLSSAAALALTACAPGDIEREPAGERTQRGAMIGALAGGVLGALSGDDGGERRRGALAGAVVGGLVGGAIGYNLDQQAAELEEELGNERIQIVNNGDFLVVRMPDDILFDVDSAAVKPTLRADLMTLAASLQRYPDSMVQVVGHTDNSGSSGYNQDLSERRASAVGQVLLGAGVNAGRIASSGLGETQPIATNLTEDGKALNRRVDITIRPNSPV